LSLSEAKDAKNRLNRNYLSGGALGPALTGVGLDRADSYQLALSLCAVARLVAALILRLRLAPTFKE
jgi:hypothetical protein